MVRPVAFAILILLGLCQCLTAQLAAAPMLEVHVDSPKWMNQCLDLTVKRVNISKQTIYLPEWEGVVFFLSTKLIRNDYSGKDRNFWLPFYGLSDIVTFDAHQLGAGSETTDHFCLPETFAVVSQPAKTRRQIETRGQVKIVASYFPTEEEWRKNKTEEEEPWHPPLEKHWPGKLWRPLQTSLEILLPCSPLAECLTDCGAPSQITDGERPVVPDVFQFHKDWNERGKTLADALSRKYSTCKN
ncbi:MAG TPA: hypothetical protein VMT67_03095 [Terriglobales bacterium]|nr:hypothetical protein [Terriglobales bacterium]